MREKKGTNSLNYHVRAQDRVIEKQLLLVNYTYTYIGIITSKWTDCFGVKGCFAENICSGIFTTHGVE